MKHNRIFIIASTFVFLFVLLWIGQTSLTNAAYLEGEDTAVSNQSSVHAIANISSTSNNSLGSSSNVYSNTLIVGELAKIVSTDGVDDDHFGQAVAIEGTRAVVSAIHEDDQGSNAGAVYVFTHNGTTWVEEAKLVASDGEEDDFFGYSVALSGDSIFVGARDEDTLGSNAGAVYVFTYNGATWVEEAKLVANDGVTNDLFGAHLAVNGDYLVVGAPGDNNTRGTDAGAAYVFMWNGSSWEQQIKLDSNEPSPSSFFGINVDIDENRILVGAYTRQAGAAYTFVRNNTIWTLEAKLQANDGVIGDNFGHAVAIDGDTAIVGAYHDDAPGHDSGSAYIFNFNGINWEQQTKLIPSDTAPDALFGHNIDLQGNVAVIGAIYDSELGTQAGAIYLYIFDGQQWNERKLLASDGDSSDHFGTKAAIDGNIILVGSRFKENSGVETGAAYFFRYQDFTASIYDPSTNELPTEVCPTWIRVESGNPVEPSITNGRLMLTTTQNTDNIGYVQTDIDLNYPLIIEARVRRISGSSSNVARTPAYIGFTTAPDEGNTLYIGQDEIFILDGYLSVGDNLIVDTDDDLHNYRIVVEANGDIEVFYDDVLALSGTTFTSGATHGSVERVIWGEISSFAQGVSEWELVAHNATSTQSCQTDLAITKSVSTVSAKPNQLITYTLAYTNHGPDVAYNTLITDIVPTHLENLSISSSGPQITATGVTSYSWKVAPLAVNESGIITITGIISPELTVDTLITNTAVISNSFDITPTNNVDTAVVQVIATQYVYLPIILKPAPKSFPVKIGDIIPVAPTDQGAVFYTTTVAMPEPIPATGKFFLSSQPDSLSAILVDDALVLSLNGSDLFTHNFSPDCQPLQEEIVALPRSIVEQLNGESVTFSYRDICGNEVQASAVWLIWVP